MVASAVPILPEHLYLAYAVRKRQAAITRDRQAAIETDWHPWLRALFPRQTAYPFAEYHAEFWDWLWSVRAGEAARPFVAIWPRGFGKSTSLELAMAAVAGRQTRTYALYVSDTQDQADDHVGNVAALLESPAFGAVYPDAAARKVGKYGTSRGWRRNRLRTASGFTLDALGLDSASRGAKIDEDRPDFLIFDDIDDVLDGPATVAKKITLLTKSILPARAPHATTLVAQNLIHADGIVAQLADGRADFLADRIVSGPHPAIADVAFAQDATGRWRIAGGQSTWPAITLDMLQAEINEIGISAFRAEKQHEVDVFEGGIFGTVTFRHCRWDEVPPLRRIVVWVDPAVTDTDHSDAHGIQVDGLADNGDIYRLYSWEQRTSPEDVIRRAILKAVELGAECVGVETDQGGDTWRTVYETVWAALIDDDMVPQITTETPTPTFRSDKAGAGHGPKAQRASQMLVDYERGRMVHVLGTHETLERALRRYLLRKPFDLVDAAYWAWRDLTQRRKVSIL